MPASPGYSATDSKHLHPKEGERDMFRNMAIFTLMALFLMSPKAKAQQWLRQLPQKPEKEMTFQDYKQAFESYYKEHPVDLSKDKLVPTFLFEGPEAIQERADIEEYKMYKRWEWFTEPRTYPSGTWDFETIDAVREKLPKEDDDLVLKQPEVNPLGVKIQKGKLFWPHLKFWKPLGPSDAIGGTNLGRVNSIQFDPANSSIIYIGAPDGGVWKTLNGGATWTPLFDRQPTLSVGDVAIDPNNSKILYAATSDAFGYGVPFWGGTYSVGVRKSTDGGHTWKHTGLHWKVGQNRTIRRLVIHPTDGKILLAATSDGLYRTGDAGATWTQIIPGSAYDAQFQPNDGNIAYATTTQVFKSTDAGATFTTRPATCPGARFSLQIARSKPSTLYVLCSNATVQKSTDSGTTWAATTAPGVSLYGYYDTILAVSPTDEKVVYVAGFNMKKTTDGGATWNFVPTAGHVDNHCIRFLPGSGSTLLVGNDGGLFKSTNSGATWTSLNKGLSITQYYGLGISRTNPTIMVLGAQDNGNMKFTAGAFSNITNADGMKGFIDWSNSNNIYAAIQNGGLLRSTNGGASFTGIGTPSSGSWVTPWQQDPSVANTIYAATNKVYKSTDQGTTWTAISPSLAGIFTFNVLRVAPSDSKYIYAGSGTRLFRTKDGGTTWTDITAGLPVATNFMTDLAVRDKDADDVYVTFSGYKHNEKVYESHDGGSTWKNISDGLPNIPVDSIVYEKREHHPVYVGTDAGVYYRNDHLHDWVPYKFGLPNVIVDHLEIHYGTKVIRAATYGRGVWEAPLLK